MSFDLTKLKAVAIHAAIVGGLGAVTAVSDYASGGALGSWGPLVVAGLAIVAETLRHALTPSETAP